MANNRRIRGKEVAVQLLVGGARQGGSLLKITDLDITVDAEITKQRFLGQKRASVDLDINGVDGTFNTHMNDHVWMTLWETIERAESLGVELPDIRMVLTFRYRGPRPKVVTLSSEFVLKLDSAAVPEDGNVTNAWSFACQDMF